MRDKSSLILVFAGRVVLLAIATAALVAGWKLTRGTEPPAAVSEAVFVCPMHAAVTSALPDTCPICRMALERSSPVSSEPAAIGSDQPIYRCPMHPEETSERPAKCRICKMPLEKAPSAADAAETSPREPLVFSFHDVTRARTRSSSRDMKGPAWLETGTRGAALLYLDECALLRPGEQGLFFTTDRPRDGAPSGQPVRLLDQPPTPWDGATALIHFELSDAARGSPKQTGWLKLETRIRRDLSVPYSAVLQSPEGPYVLVLSEGLRSVAKTPVTIGSVLYGYASIVSGLKDGDRVAAMRTFSLDVQRKALLQ